MPSMFVLLAGKQTEELRSWRRLCYVRRQRTLCLDKVAIRKKNEIKTKANGLGKEEVPEERILSTESFELRVQVGIWRPIGGMPT